uniref:Uncharacterized protein n=1 Tax=Timema monikensis TaxID=170555 RepID=A0A7R9EEK9_9NEOP|nr:unnamed protein product [Timema monikensis]
MREHLWSSTEAEHAMVDTWNISYECGMVDTWNISYERAMVDTWNISYERAMVDTWNISYERAMVDTWNISYERAMVDTWNISYERAMVDTWNISYECGMVDTWNISYEHAMFLYPGQYKPLRHNGSLCKTCPGHFLDKEAVLAIGKHLVMKQVGSLYGCVWYSLLLFLLEPPSCFSRPQAPVFAERNVKVGFTLHDSGLASATADVGW